MPAAARTLEWRTIRRDDEARAEIDALSPVAIVEDGDAERGRRRISTLSVSAAHAE